MIITIDSRMPGWTIFVAGSCGKTCQACGFPCTIDTGEYKHWHHECKNGHSWG